MTYKIQEFPRVGEYLIGDVIGGIGGPLFDHGTIDNTIVFKPGTAVAKRTADGLLVPWDPTSQVAGVDTLVGILHWGFNGSWTGSQLPAVYLARGPQRVAYTEGRVSFPAGQDAALVTALKGLGIEADAGALAYALGASANPPTTPAGPLN